MNREGLEERDGTADEIVTTRYYFDLPGGERTHLDFDGRLWAVEAVGVKKTAQLSPKELLDGVEVSDPEALRALFWMLRRHRGGERHLELPKVDFDLTSVRQYNLDGNGIRVRVRDPDIDVERVEKLAALLRAELPDLPDDDARSHALIMVATADQAAERSGEDDAGAEPAPDPSPSPTTSSPLSPEPSPSSAASTGSSEPTSTATPSSQD